MKIWYHWQLEVYKLSVEIAMEIFEVSKSFPQEEIYSLTDQVRRSSRSVSGQIAEGWLRRKYKAAFINKLNKSEGEAAETQVWIDYSVKCKYLNRKADEELHKKYNHVIAQLVNMGNNPDQWILRKTN